MEDHSYTSRTKKEDYPSNVVHSHIDLMASAEEMAQELKDVEGEYVFFSAYLQKDSEQENWKANGDMLENFLSALKMTGTSEKIKRIILVTGAKQYGVHLGAVKVPMIESDSWLTDDQFPPNFYYRQQNTLKQFCEENPHVTWVVTYPNDVIGHARGNFMNLALALGMYAAVTKELGQDLVFPGSEVVYTKFDNFTDSKLHARFCEWAALEPQAANQAFNITNGDVESWHNMWPRVAARFGLKVAPDQFTRPAPLASDVELPGNPPLSIHAAIGKIEPSRRLQQRINLVKWSHQKDVKEAWNRLAEREGLEKSAFEEGLGRSWGSCSPGIITLSRV